MLCVHCEQRTESSDQCGGCGEDPRVSGRYEISTILGRGATATTYRATDRETGDVVALKELLVRNADSLKTLELFEREAKILEQLDHPGIPRYLGDFTVDLGPNVGMYLVQEYVDGEPLSTHLGERALPPTEALHAVHGIAEVVEYLHRRSPPVVHRDIKPQNVIRRKNGRVSLIDFGSVQDAIGGSEDGVPTMAGTVGYMAPEQLLGHAEPASDIYALGATAAALLSGKPAAEALADMAGWANELPEEVPQLVSAMLASRPANRPAASELVARLADIEAPFEQLALATTRRDTILARYDHTPRHLPSDFDHPVEQAGFLISLFFILSLTLTLLFGFTFGWTSGGLSLLSTLVIGGAMLWVYFQRRRKEKLYREGAVAVGTIAGVLRTAVASTSRRGGAGTGLDVHYCYRAGGDLHRGVFSVPPSAAEALTESSDNALHEGASIIVLYEPNAPSNHESLPELLTNFRLT